jgi:hypothetical protein
MEKLRKEAILDKYARKMISPELRLFYRSIQGDVPEDVPEYVLDVLKALDGETRPSHHTDEKISTRN